MRLGEWIAKQKATLLEDLLAHREPSIGTFDSAKLKEARARGKPQMGTTRYEFNQVLLEFIYPEHVLTIAVSTPEPIRFLPVPEWVIESIWQGEIDGTFQFESDARDMFDRFSKSVLSEENKVWFGPRASMKRE